MANLLSPEQVISHALQNAADRFLAMRQLVNSATLASTIAPSAWSATLRDHGLRLNVGQVETFVLNGNEVYLNLIAEVDDASLTGLPIRATNYKTMPSPQCCFIGSIDKFRNSYEKLLPFHYEFIRRAAVTSSGKPRRGSPFLQYHSEALMAYAAEVSNQNKPFHPTSEPAYPFVVGAQYTRKDVFRTIEMPEPTGGPWFTGYASHGADWFIFCGVGTGGRTGHDYGNHFDGDNLVWFAKSHTTLKQPSIQELLSPAGHVYLFYREGDRDPFTFSGLAKPLKVFDETPVRVIWKFSANDNIRLPTQLPEELDDEEADTTFEGSRKTVQVNVYERDPNARRKCISHWGSICCVCTFDFKFIYGELGNGFIHVHHLRPLGEIGKEYELDPINDLRPVCPNCHAMLHRRKPVISIEELREIIKQSSQSQ